MRMNMAPVPSFGGSAAGAGTDSLKGAQVLRDNIIKAWRSVGQDIECEIEKVGTRHGSLYVLKTNLVNGLPPGVMQP